MNRAIARNGYYGCGKTTSMKGAASQAAEKLIFLKGTAFRPYANALK
jgi:hypothetical protein